MAQKRGCCEKLELPLAEWVVRTWCSGGQGGSAHERLAGDSRVMLGWGGGGVIWAPQGPCCLGAWKAKDQDPRLSPRLRGASPASAHPSTPSLWLHAAMGKDLPCCITHYGEKQPWAGMSEHPEIGRCGRNKEMPGHTRATPVLVEGSLAGVCWTPDLLPRWDSPSNAGLLILYECLVGILDNSIPNGLPMPPCPHMPLRPREWMKG